MRQRVGERLHREGQRVAINTAGKQKKHKPSSLTSTIALWLGATWASTFEVAFERRICESEVAERRGRLTIVAEDILRIECVGIEMSSGFCNSCLSFVADREVRIGKVKKTGEEEVIVVC
jgi:hypothetical protein